MSDIRHVVLIHGAWARGDSWGPARTAFEERGYIVHTPTLRHHELPLHEGAAKIAPLSMRDYIDDWIAENRVLGLSTPETETAPGCQSRGPPDESGSV